MQNSENIFMVRPWRFALNNETTVNNHFIVKTKFSEDKVHERALEEFDNLVKKLKSDKVNVLVLNDTAAPYSPCSIYPNNWISCHQDGTICLYPMFAPSRRLERKDHILQALEERFVIKTKIDLSNYENQECYLEGTGSMVLDHQNKLAYACLSGRTSKEVLEAFCQKMSYKPIIFYSYDEQKRAVYHTNVMLSVGDKYAVVCLESITDATERDLVETALLSSGKVIVEINHAQMNSFAGNALQLRNAEGKTLLAMSSCAYRSLTEEQIKTIEKFDKIVHSDIPTIEANGGGSVRCMIAEIFLDVKQ